MTAGDLTAILRRHYLPENRPAGGLFAAEVGSPCGKRRADALWLPLTRAGGTGLIGHEIKVSRSDVLVELTDPTKAEPWSQYCDRWWLVVSDPALVDGLEIPEAWGIMSPPSGRRTRSMTIVRSAPKLRPIDPAPGLRRLLGWHFYSTADRLSEAQRDRSWREREVDRLRHELAEARATGGVSSPHAKQRVGGIIHRAEQRLQDEHLWAAINDDEVVDAIVDATATREAARRVRDELARHMRNVDSALEPLKLAREAVEKALKLGTQALDQVVERRSA